MCDLTNASEEQRARDDGGLSIHEVEKETGITKELLRMWERRYGFPAPRRNPRGEREYARQEVDKLQVMRRLVNNGHRPAKLAPLPLHELESLCVVGQAGSHHILVGELEAELLAVLQADNPPLLKQYLHDQLARRGLYSFVMDFMRLANVMVGDAWMKGLITVAIEHRYSDYIIELVKQSMLPLRPLIHKPRVLLATLPDEQHTLGLLMVEALLRLDGIDVLNAGAEMSIPQITDAVPRHEIDVVALSFSASFSGSKAVHLLEDLRFRLPSGIGVWVGGEGIVSTRRSVENVKIIKELDAVRLAAVRWRQEQTPGFR